MKNVILILLSMALAVMSVRFLVNGFNYDNIADESIQEGSLFVVAVAELSRLFGVFACSAVGGVCGLIGTRICNGSKLRMISKAASFVNLILFFAAMVCVII